MPQPYDTHSLRGERVERHAEGCSSMWFRVAGLSIASPTACHSRTQRIHPQCIFLDCRLPNCHCHSRPRPHIDPPLPCTFAGFPTAIAAVGHGRTMPPPLPCTFAGPPTAIATVGHGRPSRAALPAYFGTGTVDALRARVRQTEAQYSAGTGIQRRDVLHDDGAAMAVAGGGAGTGAGANKEGRCTVFVNATLKPLQVSVCGCAWMRLCSCVCMWCVLICVCLVCVLCMCMCLCAGRV